MRAGVLRTSILALLAIGALSTNAAAADPPTFGPAVKLLGANGSTEPRIAITPDDHRYAVTNGPGRNSVVHASGDGGATFAKTLMDPANGVRPTIDVDIVATRTGRIISSELDIQALSFITSYSDDGGKTWTQSTGGSQTGDTDRQWLAVGPDDPKTHLPRVYLLYHNLASGTAQHNMFVTTSTDGGATFGPPVPIATPGSDAGGGSQAYQDLQCSDSGGPSHLMVNQRTGQIYAVWGTRTAQAAGGCGASIFGPFEVNVVAAIRVWIGTSADGSPGSWKTVLAVDDSKTNQIVGMQLSPGAIDNAGNVYVVYPESVKAYPHYEGAAIKYTSAPPDLSKFSAPVTVAPPGGSGNVLPHIVAGDPGKVDVAYYQGVERSGKQPVWYTTAAQSLDGVVSRVRLFDKPTYTGTASQLMGACAAEDDPTAGVQNGFVCTRSTDVWGVALDGRCRLTTTFPTRDNNAFATANPGKGFELDNPATDNDPGTFVSTQTGGSTICGSAATTPPGPQTGQASLPLAQPPPVGTGAARCRDRQAPRSAFSRRGKRLTRRTISLSGTSRDRSPCAQTAAARGRVVRVQVAVGRIVAHGCRFLGANGRFGTRRSCRRPVFLAARVRFSSRSHQSTWSFTRRVRLARGRYDVTVRGIDPVGNREGKRLPARFARVRVR